MNPIPVVATDCHNPDNVIQFDSIREAAREFGNEETLRKIISAECSEDDGGVILETDEGDWYVEFYTTYMA